MTRNTKAVVVGGGYAGVMAANRLKQRDDVSVTLINPRSDFVERIRLHQRVAGSDDAVVDYKDILADGVGLTVNSVTRINADDRNLTLATGEIIDYDYLIYSVGSGSADPDVPGAAEYAYPIATLEDAERLRPAIDAIEKTDPVTVVGAGPAGIETATELAELGRNITLVTGGQLGPYMHPKGRRSVAKRMAKLDVNVLEGPEARVTAVTSDSIELGDGRMVPSALTIWAAGFGVPDLAEQSGLSTDALGRLLTDETLTSVDDTRIVAAGDSAAPSNLPFRMSCQAAGPLGVHAADTVLHQIGDEEPGPVAMGFLGQCISLGRDGGIFQFARRDDNAVSFYIGGRLGAKVKEFVSWGTVKQLKLEANKPGWYSMPSWVNDPKRREALRAMGEPATPPRDRLTAARQGTA